MVKIGKAQNPFEADTNIACVERLQMPAYSLGRQGQMEGTITASVVLSPKPTVQLQVTTQFASKRQKVAGVLMQAVEKAIERAAFRPYCAGKTVVLIFDFKVGGRQGVSFGYPNKFWIVGGGAELGARPGGSSLKTSAFGAGQTAKTVRPTGGV